MQERKEQAQTDVQRGASQETRVTTDTSDQEKEQTALEQEAALEQQRKEALTERD